LLDVLTCGLCIVICWILPASARPSVWHSAALLIGGAAATCRAWLDPHAALDDTIIGSAWTSAMAGAVTLHAASCIPAIRRLALAALLAAIAAVASKALIQVLVEFPASQQMFQQTKARFLESQGWTPGSSMARAFERRMTQSDASAWFGISNILATFGAAVSVTMLGLLLTGWKSIRTPARSLLAAGLAAAVLTLMLTKSKGGAVAASIGVIVLLAGTWRPLIFERASRVLGVVVIVCVLGAILARAIIGERLSELSLLFRSFYIEGAIRVFLTHPLGVGPGSFKEAYLLLKNPLSPEDVSSPHSLFFDWLSTLGVFGIAWCGLFTAWVCRGARQPSVESALDEVRADTLVASSTDLSLIRPAFLILAFPALLGAFIEREAGTPESLLVRLASILLGTGTAWAILALPHLSRVALAAGTCIIAAHCQIELTPTHTGACAWLFALLGVLAPSCASQPSQIRRHAGVASLALVTLFVLLPVRSTWAWERELRAAGAFVEPLPDLQARRDAMAADHPARGDNVTALLRDMSEILGPNFRASDLPTQGQRVDATLNAVRADLLMRAREHLEAAHHHAPSHYGTLHALSQLVLQLATLTAPGAPLPPDAGLESSLVTYANRSRSASAWTWIALIRASRADRTGTGPGSVLEAWDKAIELAPWEPLYRMKGAFAARDAGEAALARDHARAALVVNENMRFDPEKQLDMKDVKALEGLAGKE
jgi:hypothetical protein